MNDAILVIVVIGQFVIPVIYLVHYYNRMDINPSGKFVHVLLRSFIACFLSSVISSALMLQFCTSLVEGSGNFGILALPFWLMINICLSVVWAFIGYFAIK